MGATMSIWCLLLISCSQGETTIASLIGDITSMAKKVGWHQPCKRKLWNCLNIWETIMEDQTLCFVAIIARTAEFRTLHTWHSWFNKFDFRSHRCQSGTGVQKQHLCKQKKLNLSHKTVSRCGPTKVPQVPKARICLQCLPQVRNLLCTKCSVSSMSTCLCKVANWAQMLQQGIGSIK